MTQFFRLKLGLYLILLTASVSAQTISIHQYNMTSNVSSTFGLGVTTFTLTLPMAPGTLSGPDLNAALAVGNVVISAPNGSIVFTTAEFVPTVAGRTITTNALNDVSFINLQPMTPNLINVFANAGGNLTVSGPGFRTAGGNFIADVGGNVNIQATGLHTAGGDVNITADGNFTQSGEIMTTGGGDFIARIGGNFAFQTGINTNGGAFDLIVDGDFTQSGNTLQTFGGNFTAEVGGSTRFAFGGSLNSGGGNIIIHTSEEVLHQGAMIFSEGGNIELSGDSLNSTGFDTRRPSVVTPAGNIKLDFTGNIRMTGPAIYARNVEIVCNNLLLTSNGILTFGTMPGEDGEVIIRAQGNVTYQGAAGESNGDITIFSNNLTLQNGLFTNGGDITLCQAGNINLTGLGLRSLNPLLQSPLLGDVDIRAGGYVSVRNGAGIYTGLAFFVNGGTTNSDGGNVNVRADSIYLYGGSINTGMRRSNYLGGGAFANGYLIDANTGTLTTVPAIGTPSSILVQNFNQITNTIASYPANLIPADQNMRFLGPYLGGGDVVLDVESAMTACIVEPPMQPIPTMNQWTIMILSLILVIFGLVFQMSGRKLDIEG